MGDPSAHVALLVDFANLRQQLSAEGGGGQGEQPDGREIARALVEFAGGIGRVGLARAYADWSREPQLARALSGTRLTPVLVPATEDGEDRSHIRLTVDAMESLYNGDGPDAFVIVSSDPSLVPLLEALRTDGSEVTIVATDSAQADELRAESDHFASFQDVMDGARGEPLVLRPTRDRAGGMGGLSLGGASLGSRVQIAGGREERAGPYAGLPILTESDFTDYDWTGFVKLIDELEQRLPFVGVRYLVNKVLGAHNCGIEDPRIKRDLINEAVDDGLIEMYTVGNVNDRTDPVTACRLDRENEMVQEILGAEAAEDDEELAEDDDPAGDEPMARAKADKFSASAR